MTARAGTLCWRDWPPHRLIVADARRVLELRVRSAGLTLDAYDLRRPLGITSSSLGDDVVEPVRRALFEQMVVQAVDPGRGQGAFHRHRWHDRPRVSVHMRRHDAATQSITTVEATNEQARMWYEPTSDLVGVPAALSIDRRKPAALAVAS